MEMNLPLLAGACFVSGRAFVDGERVVSFLVRSGSLEVKRYDLMAEAAEGFSPPGEIACRWVQVFRPGPAAGYPSAPSSSPRKTSF
jgi:hypothetical protein